MLVVGLGAVIDLDHVDIPLEIRLPPQLLQRPWPSTPLAREHLVLNILVVVLHLPVK